MCAANCSPSKEEEILFPFYLGVNILAIRTGLDEKWNFSVGQECSEFYLFPVFALG